MRPYEKLASGVLMEQMALVVCIAGWVEQAVLVDILAGRPVRQGLAGRPARQGLAGRPVQAVALVCASRVSNRYCLAYFPLRAGKCVS